MTNTILITLPPGLNYYYLQQNFLSCLINHLCGWNKLSSWNFLWPNTLGSPALCLREEKDGVTNTILVFYLCSWRGWTYEFFSLICIGIGNQSHVLSSSIFFIIIFVICPKLSWMILRFGCTSSLLYSFHAYVREHVTFWYFYPGCKFSFIRHCGQVVYIIPLCLFSIIMFLTSISVYAVPI